MASGLKQVRTSIVVGSAINAALGSLRLFSPDPAARLEAAEAVFKSHDAAALDNLTRRSRRRNDPAVKQRLEQARAAALLFSTDAARRTGWQRSRCCGRAAICRRAACSPRCQASRRWWLPRRMRR